MIIQSEYQRTIAKRALAIVKKHRLLENAIKDEETIILRSFFEAPEPKPNRKIVSIVDKAVEFVVYTLIIRSKELRIIEDHEMQRFLQDTDKAKRTLFSEIMANPEFLSRDWGGDQVARRIQKTLTDDKQTTESGGDEEVDVSLAKAASIIAGRLYNIPTNLHHAAVNKKTASGHTAEDERVSSV
uniref:MAGE domain-containing protein n=1 Tax=Angiostrongylus cantonensis TaxID=6313 RepID=A0A0K0D3G9_ANGCA